MKKYLVATLVGFMTALFSGIVCFASMNIYQGKMSTELPEKIEDIVNHLEEVSIGITKLSVNGSVMSLKGEVIIKNETIPINLNGNIFKSNLHEKSYYISAVDNEKNFEVVNFQVVKNMLPKELLVHNTISVEDTFVLYLQQKNSKGLILIEIPVCEMTDNLFELIDSNNIPDMLDITEEHWWLRYFQPSEIGLVENRSSSGYTRVVSMYHNGVYLYTMDLYTFIDYYNFSGETQGFYSGMYVAKQDYYYNGVHQGNNEFLTVYECTGEMKLQNSSGINNDCIVHAGFGHQVQQTTGGFQVGFSPRISASFHGFGGSFSWTPLRTEIGIEGGQSFDEADHVNGVRIPFVRAIKAKGDKYSMNVEVAAGQPRGNKKQIVANYEFKVGFQGITGSKTSVTTSASGIYVS
ncbi:hypothetical protein [Cuneatibacter caecimuris]|uniref:Uncharacterized protein n=1 Tax=Cuneatibacter caecimuris TaxID=1796618 RepID=A0A4Q7PKB2_9FIRM|nr:hypothetical protein [Cuneatibacter caecimuris]RZT01161.1 hypothetical protein EV209_1603 [Cuneatibacter caecimuris]